MKKILIVVSSTNTLELQDNNKFSTGYYLNELAIPAQYFIDSGYSVVIATPNGKKPPMDERSNNVLLFNNNEAKFKAALKFIVSHPSMQKPITLKAASENSKDYVAVFVPGGHGPMNDLMVDENLGKILREYNKEKKVTSFLCHGTIAALSSLPNAFEFKNLLLNGNLTAARELAKFWQYRGYNMTVFSDDEEEIVEKEIKGKLKFYASDALTLAGGFIENASVFKPFIVHDRELVTGQNPASDLELAKAVVKAIAQRKAEKMIERPFNKYGEEEYSADI